MEYITDRDTLKVGDYCTCIMGALSGTDYIIFMKMIERNQFTVKMQIGAFHRTEELVDIVNIFDDAWSGDWTYSPPMDRFLYRLDFQEVCHYILMGEL